MAQQPPAGSPPGSAPSSQPPTPIVSIPPLNSGPPAKRPRLSPDGHSPYPSQGMGNIALPNQAFTKPYYGAPNGHSYQNYNTAPSGTAAYSPPSSAPYTPQPSYNSSNAQPHHPAQSPSITTHQTSAGITSNMMAPPDRPEHKPTDLNELGDVLYGAGVDLKEEEAALLRSRNQNANQRGYSANEQIRDGVPPQYPFSRTNVYSQNQPGEQSSFYGAGDLNQQPKGEDSVNEVLEEERKKAVRRQAEIKQYHLNNPFLFGGTLQRRLYKEAGKLHVQIPAKETDILKPAQPKVAPQQITVAGPDGNSVVKIVSGEPLLLLKNGLVEVLSLLSLATEERLRVLVEDAASLAQGRKLGSHGLVPLEMADLAVPGKFDASTANGQVKSSPGDLKRSYTSANDLTMPVVKRHPPSLVAQTLQRISKAERAAEEARLAKRRKRKESADTTQNDSGSLSLNSSEPGTPASVNDVAPDLSALKKPSLKSLKKQPTESQQFAASNKAASMALGAAGIRTKQPSWMMPNKKPTNPYQQDKSTPKASGASGQGAAGKGETFKSRVWGDFKEDGPQGAGIQLRDLVSVLEYDGKGGKALQLAYGKLQRRDNTKA